MNGYDAIKSFSEWKDSFPLTNNINNDILIIGMSANATVQEQDAAFGVGMHFFASKPVNPQYLGWMLTARKAHLHIGEVVSDLMLQMALNLEGDKLSSSSGILRGNKDLLFSTSGPATGRNLCTIVQKSSSNKNSSTNSDSPHQMNTGGMDNNIFRAVEVVSCSDCVWPVTRRRMFMRGSIFLRL